MILNICVPIKLKSGDLEKNKQLVSRVIESHPEYIEFRLDYFDDPSQITLDLLNSLIKKVHSNEIKVILTFRSSSEGGQAMIDINERLRIMTTMINSRPDFIDVEMNADDEIIKDSVSLALQNRIWVIFSYHDLKTTPTYQEARNIINNFNYRLTKQLSIDATIMGDCPYKLIFSAKKFEDNLVPLRLCQDMSEMKKGIISFCMGDAGIFSRVSCVKYGALLTFASLDDQTAPGQITITKMREAHNILYRS